MKAKFLALAALVLGMVSCQNDFDGANVGNKGEVDLTLSVAVPEMETRAAGNTSDEGGLTNIDLENDYDIRYILEVYDANGDLAKERMYSFEDTADNTTFNLRLVPGRGYSFVVWADFVPQVDGERDAAKSYDYHYNTSAGLTKVMVVKDQWTAINESRDAYTGKHFEADFRSSSSILVTLTRPFAKLRVVTTDIKELYGDLMPETVKVNYLNTYFYNEFNALKQDVEGQPEATGEKVVNLNTMTYENEDPKGTGVMTLFADYFFRATDDRVMFTMDVQDNTKQDIPTIVFNTNIPVKRNYLTTVMGPVLTDANSISVTIEEGFANGTEWNPEDDKYDVEVWDGKTLNAPVDSNNDGIYEIGTGAQLAYLAAAVNGTLPSTASTRAGEVDWAKEEFVLTANIDLDNNNWTPIGNSTNTFQGTFDGQGKTIYNLRITGNKSNVGFFGFTTNGEIKNLVVENAKVSGYLNVAVVAGTPYTSKYTNITVQGHVEINGFAYVGAVGGKNAYANWTNITVNVDETSYVNANSIEGSTAYRTYVGGVCGFNGEGGHSFTNITSNINVKGSTCDVGGLFGIAHYGNKFENCSCSGDVEIYATEDAVDAQEIGGIAGVWHNENGTTVTMTNCSFTGELKTNIADVDFYYGGLVGKPYSKTGTGILWLNGNKCLANGIIEDAEGNLVVNSPESLEAALKTAGAAGAGDTTIVFAENTNINMTNAEWTPIYVNGYQGADIVTIEGNGAVIKGLTAPLFQGGFAGGSGIIIKNLTITESNIVSTNTQGSGAFIECVDSMETITLENCHFTKSTLSGSRTGGLIGWTSGYSNENDGPVKTYVTIKNCSVIDVDINATGSAAAINGHAGASDWTYTTIENCTVKDCNINSTDSGSWRTGVVVGTANIGEVTISNITESGNTLTQIGKTAPEGFKRNYFGRFVPGTTGKLTIDGYVYDADGICKDANGNVIVASQATLQTALKNSYDKILLLAGNYELSGLSFAANNVTLKGVDKANVVLNLENSIYLQNKSVTLENLTYNLNAGKVYTEQAFAFVHHATAFNLKNCNVNRLRLNVYEANIEDCTFTLNTSSGFDGYCIYYYGNDNSTVNVKNSTFATAGKGICIYSESAKAYNLNVDKCSFTSSDSATDKAAIQMHTELGISGNVKITETTATGFADINGGLWNELNNNTKVATDKFDIWVDGTQVH